MHSSIQILCEIVRLLLFFLSSCGKGSLARSSGCNWSVSCWPSGPLSATPLFTFIEGVASLPGEPTDVSKAWAEALDVFGLEASDTKPPGMRNGMNME